MERFPYRGYDILTSRQWSNWCVSIYPTHAELPFVSRSTLDILRPRLQDAMPRPIIHQPHAGMVTSPADSQP